MSSSMFRLYIIGMLELKKHEKMRRVWRDCSEYLPVADPIEERCFDGAKSLTQV
jgi:hypothetical protein